MAVATPTSFVLSVVFAILVFSGMQMYRSWFASTQLHTIFGGYVGSILFILILTAVGNLETIVFGKASQLKYIEVLMCLFASLFASGMVHRVCVTTCFIFSLIGLYYVNRISQKIHAAPIQQNAPVKKKGHK
ncbi:protein KRTCAP2 homolog [Arctopsyche grandis]|uniref:protein KRTCAP2 homolog n=1 Tax=Arctopsyche grandis TaxID=121162 RepID=UPI00406D8CA7